MGAVDSLLITEGFESADGLTFKALAALADGYGTSCFQILSCAADSVSFCSGYRIAGILRYALDDLVDEPEDQGLEPAQESEESCESTQLSESEQSQGRQCQQAFRRELGDNCIDLVDIKFFLLS